MDLSEIQEVIPVPKGTLAGWCRDIHLTEQQVSAIKERVQSQRGIPKNSQWRRHLEIEAIRSHARLAIPILVPYGVCRVLMRRSGDAWHRTMAWIDGLAAALESST